MSALPAAGLTGGYARHPHFFTLVPVFALGVSSHRTLIIQNYSIFFFHRP